MSPENEAVEAKRLTLKPLVEADALSLFEAVQSSRDALRRRLVWVDEVTGPEDEAAFIRRQAEAAGLGAGLAWGLLDRQSGGLVGVASLDRLDQKQSGKAELSCWVRSDQQDKGFATEAVRALCEHAFGRLLLHRVYARIDPANRPSRKVLKKLKFHYEGALLEDKKLNGRWVNQECWGMLRSEWTRQHR